LEGTLTSLTPRQREIYLFIDQYHEDHGFSPTQEEIAEGTSMSRTTLREHLTGLEKKGYISQKENIPRSITITQSA